MKTIFLLIFALLAFKKSAKCQDEMSCEHEIYCQGQLLHTVQMALVYTDSKTFVDMSLKDTVENTLANFQKLMSATENNPSRDDIKTFINDNFDSESELEEWEPPDFQSHPEFLQGIKNVVIRNFAKDLVGIWPTLARKVKKEVSQNPDRHSLIPVPNGFIIPGGRFREFYYWDSYWIVKGLLISEMNQTVKFMLNNYVWIIRKYGFIPNGGRIYYLHRSQPPLFTLMVADYIEATNDLAWLKQNIKYMDKEMQFWLNRKVVEVKKDGISYHLAHFVSKKETPRPESYVEDIITAGYYQTDEEKKECYSNIRSGAETGWDFSSRWIVDNKGGNEGNLTFIATKRIIPVDLNAFLCKCFRTLHTFYKILNNEEKSIFWLEKAILWEKNIQQVLYNEEDGIWYDYDNERNEPRKYFYPSNFAPLWAESYNPAFKGLYGRRAVNYVKMQGLLDYPGGIPTSLIQSGEQWDYPNAWAPLQVLVILGLDKTGEREAVKIADELARKWVRSNLKAFHKTNEMYEKYNAIYAGEYGSGGEYVVQTGFGWTNGVALELILKYYTDPNEICI